MRRFLKEKGQAIVEFALAATLIFFLLAAAVDLGLMFFAVQGLHNAAQEGATYGSRWLIFNGGVRSLDFQSIRDRVRHESGAKGGIGFVNLLDLNNNGVRDVNPDTPAALATCMSSTSAQAGCDWANGAPVINNYIQIQMLEDTDTNGDPLNDGTAPNYTQCTNPSGVIPCFIRVTVSYDYKLSFPLSPTFARQRTLHSSFIMQMRDSYAAGDPEAPAPVFATATPTPQVLTMSVVNFYKASGTSKPASLRVLVRLNGVPYDGATVGGTIGGQNVTLNGAGGGTGYYAVCAFGSFNGNSVTAHLTAANSTGASYTLSPDPSSSTTSFSCP